MSVLACGFSRTQKAKAASPQLLEYYPDVSQLQETEIQFDLPYCKLGGGGTGEG